MALRQAPLAFRARAATAVVLLFLGCGAPPSSTPAIANAPSPPRSTEPAPPSAQPPAASSSPPAAPIAARCEPIQTSLPELITTDIDVPVPAIEDPTAQVMTPLHDKLARLVRGKATEPVRIGMYGDSNMTRDFITGEMRRTFQTRNGDAGHGFISLGQPWSWYLHQDIRHGLDKDGWKSIDMSTDQVLDRMYGFAGIAAEAQRPNAVSWVATSVEPSVIGRKVSLLDVYFLKRPKGGTFDIRVDGKVIETVDTKSPQIEAGFHAFEVDDAPHRVDFVSGPKGLVRLMGVVLERKAPGIVVDSLGIGGVSMELIARGDRAIAIQTLRRRKYDLVIFLTGATESDTPGHAKAVEQLVALHREALPGVAILMMSPPDLAGGPDKKPTLNPRMGRLSREKRRLALATGCAYWDFRGAMGGDQSIVRFTDRGMAWNDYIHLSEKGGAYMGRRIAYAIWRDLMGYLERHPTAGCDG
ncbi:MAG: hypothetical protein HY898_32815 [Deltaproteobacteria bacterium]|nr:hypothetical protein [Deltaproteobacteria bacterium]